MNEFRHESHHGFCTVCGAVWPCARAQRTPGTAAVDPAAAPAIPVPRFDALPVAA